MRSLHSIAERSPFAERLWPFSTNVTVLVALQIAFWLGVVITMVVYQVGFLERVS